MASNKGTKQNNYTNNWHENGNSIASVIIGHHIQSKPSQKIMESVVQISTEITWGFQHPLR